MFHTRTPRSLITVAALATIAVAAPPASAQDNFAIDYNPQDDTCTFYDVYPVAGSEPTVMKAEDAKDLAAKAREQIPTLEAVIRMGGFTDPDTGQTMTAAEAGEIIATYRGALPMYDQCAAREDYNLAAIVGDGGNNNPDPYIDPNHGGTTHDAGMTDTELTEDETIGMVIGLIFLVMIIGGILSALSGVIPGLTISF